MQRLILLAVSVFPLMFVSLHPGPPHLTWWTASAMEKVRPYSPAPEAAAQAVQLFAARNEFESFQVVFRAGRRDIHNFDLEMSDLVGPSGAVLSKDNAWIYFERFMNLAKPSSVDGASGEWPDALIPRTDVHYGERRNGFPFTARGGRNQPIWIELYVPPSTPAGEYRGSLSVLVEARKEIEIPVKLEVWDFTLPSTSSLITTFGFNGITSLRQHFGRYTNDRDLYRITSIYRKAALRHRISLHGGSMTPPAYRMDGDHVQIDWETFDAEVGPFLDGVVFAEDEPLAGARATSTELRTHGSLAGDHQKILYWREFARHFKEKQWIDRLFNYVWDEPAPEHYAELLRRSRLVHAADPALKNLVTAPLKQEWTGEIDIWSPVINCFFARPGFHDYCFQTVDRAAYKSELASGDKLWWYQACASHGCYIVGGDYFRGWPSYVIDTSGVANRIMQWMSWRYGLGGELYFNINEAYAEKGDAWENIYAFGGNGDGTLVYPGTPAKVGGGTHIPIESIRLKLIREGLEDYEYMTLLTAVAGAPATASFVDGLIRNGYTFENDPAKLYETRRGIAEAIMRFNHSRN